MSCAHPNTKTVYYSEQYGEKTLIFFKNVIIAVNSRGV